MYSYYRDWNHCINMYGWTNHTRLDGPVYTPKTMKEVWANQGNRGYAKYTWDTQTGYKIIMKRVRGKTLCGTLGFTSLFGCFFSFTCCSFLCCLFPLDAVLGLDLFRLFLRQS